MDKPEPRRTFEGAQRIRELQSVIPSKKQSLATLNERVAGVRESLRKLYELRDESILTATRESLRESPLICA